MDFTPGERAVLAQIRVLYKEAGRDQQVRALTMQWPPTHHETYRNAFSGLLAKQMIQDLGAQAFRITDAGLKAIGVALAPAQPAAPRVEQKRPAAPVRPQAAAKPRASGLARLVKGLLRA